MNGLRAPFRNAMHGTKGRPSRRVQCHWRGVGHGSGGHMAPTHPNVPFHGIPSRSLPAAGLLSRLLCMPHCKYTQKYRVLLQWHTQRLVIEGRVEVKVCGARGVDMGFYGHGEWALVGLVCGHLSVELAVVHFSSTASHEVWLARSRERESVVSVSLYDAELCCTSLCNLELNHKTTVSSPAHRFLTTVSSPMPRAFASSVSRWLIVCVWLVFTSHLQLHCEHSSLSMCFKHESNFFESDSMFKEEDQLPISNLIRLKNELAHEDV